MVAAELTLLDAQTPSYKMGHRARINDIRFQLEAEDTNGSS